MSFNHIPLFNNKGFGNVGYWASHYLVQNGAILIGVAEFDGSIYNQDGLNPDDLFAFKNSSPSKGVYNYPKAKERFKDASVMHKECDILIPAAMEKTINMHNMEKLQCKIIAESANGPTTIAAEQYLNRKGILILPDVLLNVGGVTVSYFEWLKNLEHVKPGTMTRRVAFASFLYRALETVSLLVGREDQIQAAEHHF